VERAGARQAGRSRAGAARLLRVACCESSTDM